MPELKILYISGYSPNVIGVRDIESKGVSYLQKPFNNEDLAEKIREVLDLSGPHRHTNRNRYSKKV
jgi:FixJ family two-component response regulator